jgi:hypothetical protein
MEVLKSSVKHFFCLIILISNLSFGNNTNYHQSSNFCQTNQKSFQKQNGESNENFVNRLKPENSTLTHKVICTKWNSLSIIIAFYEQSYKLSKDQDPDQNIYKRIIATLFVENLKNNYSKIIINSFDNDGGPPKIETVLFTNADNDSFKELIIIVSWKVSHYEMSGTIYNTFVYDNLNKNKQIIFLKDISEKLEGGCECSYSNGKNDKAKFKTAKEIKSELLRLGIKN